MAWYRTYRPQTVKELAITPVREQLEAVLKTGKYSHAYLFAGPKGTGKTSTARIMARILNEPKNAKNILAGTGPLSEPSSADLVLDRIAQGRSQVVIEQDAASHRGIDDIRQLQEQVSIIPTEGLIRVVILDEVHMLTTEAFNALLKLLEEPPERVVFVLATTELHKVPATVQSRCQMIRFRQASSEEIQLVLQQIAQKEGVQLSTEEAQKLAEISQGSFRDAVKYFESVVEEGSVSDTLSDSLFAGQSQSSELLKALAVKSAENVSVFFRNCREAGNSFSVLEQELFVQLQSRLHRAIERKEPPATVLHICELTSHLVDRVGGYEPIEGLKLELACLSWCLSAGEHPKKDESQPGPEGGKSIVLEKKKNGSVKHELAIQAEPQADRWEEAANDSAGQASLSPEPVVTVQADAVVVSSPSGDASLSRQVVESEWPQFLLKARTESQALESLLRMAALVDVSGATLELQVELPFHKEKIESGKYASLLRRLLREKFHPNADFRVTIFQKTPSEVLSNDPDGAAGKDQLLAAVEAAVLSLEDNLIYSEQNSVS